jgi:hypothetical protein
MVMRRSKDLVLGVSDFFFVRSLRGRLAVFQWLGFGVCVLCPTVLYP